MEFLDDIKEETVDKVTKKTFFSFDSLMLLLSKAERTQGIGNYNSFNTFSSKHRLEILVKLQLVFLAKGDKNIERP